MEEKTGRKNTMNIGWGKYAAQTRLKQKGYLRKHRNRSESGETPKASRCHCLFCSPKEQEKVEVVNESTREEILIETHQEGRQGIQSTDQGRYATEEIPKSNTKKGKIMAKETKKEKMHEAKESKAYEKKEDKKEKKKKS